MAVLVPCGESAFGSAPTVPNFGKAEINNLVGLLEVAPSCPGLILNEGHRIGFEIVSDQILDFTQTGWTQGGSCPLQFPSCAPFLQ